MNAYSNELTAAKLYELYRETLNNWGTNLLHKDSATISLHVFEEFDCRANLCLHPSNLQVLYKKGFISKAKLDKSLALRSKMLALKNTEEWSVGCIKSSASWRSILLTTDEIKALV